MSGRASTRERIRRLLAMAGDASSPHEAAIAARRADSLMRQYVDRQSDVDEEPRGSRAFGELSSRELSGLQADILAGLKLALSELGVSDAKKVVEVYHRELGPELARIRAASKSGYLW